MKNSPSIFDDYRTEKISQVIVFIVYPIFMFARKNYKIFNTNIYTRISEDMEKNPTSPYFL